MGLFSRDKTSAIRAVVPASEFRELGTIGGQMYLTRKGVEFVVRGGAGVSDASELPLHAGDVAYAVRLREVLRDGEVFESTRYKRGEAVPAGTYARLTARQEAQRTTEKDRDRVRPVDVHRIFGIVRGQAEVAIAGPGRGLRTDKLVVASPDLFGLAPNGAHYSPPTPDPETPAEVIAFYSRKGVTLTALPGHRLLIEAKRGRLSQLFLDDLRADERRLVAYLAGRWPLPCEVHPDRRAHDAVRTFAIDVLGCDG